MQVDRSVADDPGRYKYGRHGVNALAGIGNIVVSWNTLENQMRVLTAWFKGVPFLKTHQQNARLATWLEESTQESDPAARDHVRRFAIGFDRLREHRNRVVPHSRYVNEGAAGVSIIMMASGKKGVELGGELTVSDMATLVDGILQWSEFARQINMRYTRSDAHPDDFPPLKEPALPSELVVDWIEP